MLGGEHSAILLTFIKLPFSIKTFWSFFKWSLKTGVYYTIIYYLDIKYSAQLVIVGNCKLLSLYFSTKINVVGTQKNRLIETVLLSTKNICLD